MTAKTSLLVLFLTCLGLGAQTPPAPASAPPANPKWDASVKPRWDTVPQGTTTNQFTAVPTNAAADSNRNALMQHNLRRMMLGNTNRATGAPALAPVPPFAQRSIPPVGATNLPVAPAGATGPRTVVPGITPPGLPAPGTNAPGSAAATPEAALPPGAVAPGEQVTQIKPPPGATNAPPEEVLPAGTINFPATDLNQVLQIYAELVNRTILRPTTLPAPTITLKTQTPLTRREAIQAFDAVLHLNGIDMLPIGDKFVKALPAAQAGMAGAEWNTIEATNLPNLGPYITHVAQLNYTRPSEIIQALQPFASAPTAILPIDSSQILVLRDATENVKRMLEMIKKIDVAVPAEFISEVIPIKYALASDIASALNSLSSGGSGTTVGSSGGTTAGHTGMVGGFNRPGGTGSYPGGTTPGGSPFGGSPFGTTPGATPFGTSSTMNRPGTTTPGTGSSFTSRLQSIINKAATSGEITVLGQTKIIADERTNSLLIFASREDMKMIKDIVSKLDIVLAQVLIEAVVIQVSLDNSRDLGVSYVQSRDHPTQIGDSFTGLGALNNKNIFNRDDSGSSTNGIFGNLPGGFGYLAQLGHNQDLSVFVTAVASGSKAKILQRPRIQTSNAKQASLFVGQSRPYPTSSYYGGGGYGGYSSIQQLQIGVTLEVTPLINPDGLVVMDIHQKIDSFQGNVTIANVGDVPITSSKEAMASVAVRDHDTIMLGGLIETDKNENNSGVPVLKDIPLLGHLFRSSSKSEQRNELIVLIRPTVLPTPEVAALTAKAEKDRMPGVRSTEQEIQFDEARRARQADKEYNKLEQSHPAPRY